MKNPFFRPLLAVLLTCSLQTAPADPAPEKLAAPVDLSQFKTADDLWTYLLKVGGETPPRANSQEEYIHILQSWLERQRVAAEAFLKKFPEDARRWDAKVVALMTAIQLQKVGGLRVDVVAGLKDADAILAAPDAIASVKSEAAYLRVQLLAQIASPEKPETLAPLQKAVTEFLDNYSESKRAGEVAQTQVALLHFGKPADADAILKKLAASKNDMVAETAKRVIEQTERVARLKNKPFELKFTAADGREVDVAKLRGKVVLIDFWASWCPPCMAELPGFVSTYKKLHDKGFEIVGISLDQERAEMEAVLKKEGITWPQYFDSNGPENKIAKAFEIVSIPVTWLLDKKGMLRESDLGAAELGKSVEKLLAE